MSPPPPSRDVRPGSGAFFDAIAPRYDLLNRILSLGIDQGWRARAVRALELPASCRVLDLATGTGDLAFALARAAPAGQVVGVDPSTGMLEIARTKIPAALGGRVQFEEGDAQDLRFADASFDAATIAFGIRNVPDRAKALREMARVVRPGGAIAILELGEPRSGLLAPLARFHVHSVVPTIGAWLSGAAHYRYLERSIAAFPPPGEFLDLMRSAGLSDPRCEPLAFGACHLFVGRVA